MKKVFLLALLAMGIAGPFSGEARAYTLYTVDFESLRHDDEALVDHGAVYAEGDFILTNTATVAGSGFEPSLATLGTANALFTGSTSLFNDNPDGETVLTAVDGLPFRLYSIDLAELFAADYAFDVTFTGYLDDGSLIYQTVSLDGLFGAETFAFDDGFTELRAVSWSQSLDFHQFDNIRAQIVPEPSTFALIALGLLGLGVLHRRGNPYGSK